MGANVEPGRYRAVLVIDTPSRYSPFPHSLLLTEIVHHIAVSIDGEVTETHYESNLLDGVGGDKSVCNFNPPRRWDPKLLDEYQLTPEY
ncbi:MAG: hypothetical protein ACOCSK_03285 [Rhodothermales bacterium]